MDRLSPVSIDSGFASNASIEIPQKIFYDMSVPLVIPESMMLSPPLSEPPREDSDNALNERMHLKKDTECELDVASCSCLSSSQGSSKSAVTSEGAVPTIPGTDKDDNTIKVPEVIFDEKESESNRCCSRSSSVSVRSSSRSRDDLEDFPLGRKRPRTLVGEICYLDPSPSSSSLISQACSFDDDSKSQKDDETPKKKVKTPSESLPSSRFSFSPILISCSWKDCHLRYPNFNDVYDHVIQAHIRPFLDLPSSKPSSSKSPDCSDDIVAECEWADCEMAMERGDRQKKYSWLCDHFRTRHAKLSQPFKCVISGCCERFKTTEKLEEHVRIDHINGNALKKKEARERELMAGFMEWQPLPKPKSYQKPSYSRSLDQKVHGMILKARDYNFAVMLEPRRRPGVGSAHRKAYAQPVWDMNPLCEDESYTEPPELECHDYSTIQQAGPSSKDLNESFECPVLQSIHESADAESQYLESEDDESQDSEDEEQSESGDEDKLDEDQEASEQDSEHESEEDNVDDVSMNDLFPGWNFDSMKDQYFIQKEAKEADRLAQMVKKSIPDTEIGLELPSRIQEPEELSVKSDESDWDADEELSDEEEEY